MSNNVYFRFRNMEKAADISQCSTFVQFTLLELIQSKASRMKHPLLEYIVQIRKTKQKQTKNIQNEEATYVLNSPKQFRPSPSQPSLQVHCPRPSGELRRHSAFESQNTPSHEPSARRENDRSMTPVVTVKTIILSKQILHHRSSLQSMKD